MKYEWRKRDKELYLPKKNPAIIEVPEQKFIMLKGNGDPNSKEFTEAIGVLYSLAYAIKTMPKKGIVLEGYFDYTVFPLEGIWDKGEKSKCLDVLIKEDLIYTLMIHQPDFVTQDLLDKATDIVKKKKPHNLLEKVRFGSINEGLCVQMLHIGSYDNEPESFDIMNEFCKKNKLIRKSYIHHEIYISDARKVSPESLKTVLRFEVEREV
ncbi:TPA: GyrI-like domain-containing protein [Clostridioides difficile]|uniref:GyrI-like domain-containing protein n=1 Tax=Clostridioides difficile TaxID=1496 RepID=UPI000D1D7E63|nr:GyrI-like domain-containing protein [Clostridioides difficile]HCQ5551261.1 GyrI-like domain-containing protein [Clostridioides difficile]